MVTATRPAPKQPSVSASAIKAKLAAKQNEEQNLAQKTLNDKVELTGKAINNAKSKDQTEEMVEPLIGKSDIAKNDGKDPVTQEKLKTLLRNDGFSFNPKEKEVLSQILQA
jgi:hypothetical protein